MLFDLIDRCDCEIFHRNVAHSLNITEQLIAAKPKHRRPVMPPNETLGLFGRNGLMVAHS